MVYTSTMPDIRRSNRARREKVRARVFAEEDICWLCKRPVDKTLDRVAGRHNPQCARPDCPGCLFHPLRKEVDEVVPVSKGGSPYERSNCRLAHRICNQRRGNKVPELAPVVRLPSSVTTRDWG